MAAFVGVFCLPLAAGCSAQTVYTLKTDEDGGKYYEVSVSGFSASLSGELTIPAYYGEGEDYAPVTSVADEGLAGTKLKKITLPETITHLGVAAFGYNYSLTEVVFSDGIALQEISQSAFCYCTGLMKISVPDSVTKIGYWAFYNCTSLENVSLPDSLTAISYMAFAGCTALESISLPDGLQSIGIQAFYSSGLTEIVIPDSVCDTQTPVTGEDGEPQTDEDGNPVVSVVYGLGYAAFHSCVALKTAVVGSGVTVLRSGVFGYCTALEEIYLPASLQEIEGPYYSDGSVYFAHPFHSDAALTDVYFAGTQQEWEELLKHTDSETVTYQSSSSNNNALFNAQVHCGATYSR